MLDVTGDSGDAPTLLCVRAAMDADRDALYKSMFCSFCLLFFVSLNSPDGAFHFIVALVPAAVVCSFVAERVQSTLSPLDMRYIYIYIFNICSLICAENQFVEGLTFTRLYESGYIHT